MSEPTPTPKPMPRPIPRPATPATQPVQAPIDESAAARAAAWGRVDSEGNVWLRSDEGERCVGQYAAGGSKEDALAFYVRRYLELAAQVALLESRIEHISPDEAAQSLTKLEEQLVEPAAVGDIQELRTRTAVLKERIAQRRKEVMREREAARQAAIAERTALIERAEAIAGGDPATIHWRNSREELAQIFESWKAAQRNGVRIDRPTEEALWQRYSKARSQFDKMRRQHFAALEAERSDVIARKSALIARAEALMHSTDWSATAREYRELMDEWRAAGRASRKDDDKLWARFRAAQQTFFDARAAHFAQRDAEFEENLKAKLELLKEAEQILPVRDLEAARNALHSIQDRWEEIGMVPRAEVSHVEGRLRRVEDAVREAEAEKWRKSDPQKKQRSSGMAAQLEQLIAELNGQIEEATAAGDEAKVAELNEALEARKAWLAQVQKDL
jgi:Domain of Unknown Function (DUF349).